MPDWPRTAWNGISVEFEISQLLGVPLMTHASGTRLYISERLSSLILQDGLARLGGGRTMWAFWGWWQYRISPTTAADQTLEAWRLDSFWWPNFQTWNEIEIFVNPVLPSGFGFWVPALRRSGNWKRQLAARLACWTAELVAVQGRPFDFARSKYSRDNVFLETCQWVSSIIMQRCTRDFWSL